MRPQKARRIIQQAIDDYLYREDPSRLYSQDFRRAADVMYVRYLRSADDHRSGDETYGYGTKENIINTVNYISDRWGCAFRLRWLMDGVRGRHF